MIKCLNKNYINAPLLMECENCGELFLKHVVCCSIKDIALKNEQGKKFLNKKFECLICNKTTLPKIILLDIIELQTKNNANR